MRVVLDIEANSLNNPSQIWLIVCKDIDTNLFYIFRNITTDDKEKQRFLTFRDKVSYWIGHNLLGYDLPNLVRLIARDWVCPNDICVDTLIISKLVDYSRKGHSIEQYGEEFGLKKIKFNDWTKWSQEMEDYCVRDVDICHKVYLKYVDIINNPVWRPAIDLEQRFQGIVNSLTDNGFAFNLLRANKLLSQVTKELAELDSKISASFPPKEVLIREFTPKLTKFGTISRTSVPRQLHPSIHEYRAGETYRHTHLVPFNSASHKQLIEVLTIAKWKPEDKTQAHIDALRNKLDLTKHKVYGWKINEVNLGTLPPDAPEGARLLAKRILLESRRRTLVEWLGLCGEDGRIHGKFHGIGAWTHRMAHQRPNTANIPREFKEDGTPKLLGKEMRSLWCAPKNRLLVGVDAEGIQLRVFAHYIDDKEFTDALINGRKSDKTDPHSFNQRILGSVCKTRQSAKRFVYALLLGGGMGKLAQILECSIPEAKESLDNLLQRYTGLATMRKSVFPRDARRGYFTGLDGRLVPIPGETQRDREHLAMSGYLQNGEAIIVKRAAIIADAKLVDEKKRGQWFFVNIVHDELQSETKNSMDIALKVAQIKSDAIKQAGEELKLKCPMAGSYFNEDHKDYTIGTNWYQTH